MNTDSDHGSPGDSERGPLGDLMLPVFRVRLVRETGIERIELEGPAKCLADN